VFGVGLTTPHSKKLIVTKVKQREKLDRFNDAGWKRTKDTKITLATWNVQTMLKPGRMIEIMEEISKARAGIVAVQEIRWQGQGRIFHFLLELTQRKDGLLWDRIYYKCKNEEKLSFFGSS
jgi:hypothetical protein